MKVGERVERRFKGVSRMGEGDVLLFLYFFGYGFCDGLLFWCRIKDR